MANPDGYSYSEFFEGVVREHGRFCWVHGVLAARRKRAARVDSMVLTAGIGLAENPVWQAVHYACCDEQRRTLSALPALDAHHLVSKQRLKGSFPRGVVLIGPEDAPELRVVIPGEFAIVPGEVGTVVPLGGILSDGRWGVPVCRLHHDRLERRLVKLQRCEIPAVTEEAAQGFGVGWSLDRDYGEAEAVTAEPREAA